jgi:hypothetical protein
MSTQTWTNTIDNTPPVSQVSALPSQESPNAFAVAWTGADVGAGIASYTIYVSDSGGPFAVFQNAVATTSASFTGQVGHTYGFYSIATDAVGNVEAAKATAEATTTVVSVVNPPTLQSIGVTPVSPSIVVGTALQFAATGIYTDGTTQNLAGSVTWSSGMMAFATITTAGKASGVKVGSSTISASATNPVVIGSTTLTVTPLGPCDVTQHGLYTVVDAQAIINEALGAAQTINDLNGDNVVNVVDVQIVINAVLSLVCTV